MPPDEDDDAYYVQEDERGFRVLDDTEQTVITCRERESAEHYAVLLNRAWRKGYRAGRRETRRG